MTSKAFAGLSRRGLLAGAAAIGAGGLGPAPAAAKAPRANVQAPAFYRFNVGSIEATVVSDGPLMLGETSAAYKAPKPEIDKLVEDNFLSPANFVAEQNALVLNLESQLVLVDTGVGVPGGFGPQAGRLLSSLRQAGIDPKDIDAVVITHAHPDHLAGLMSGDGTRNFPNARVFMTEADYGFWTDEQKLGSPLKDFIALARANLNPNRDRMVFVKDGDEFLPGIQALATPGHTVGHMSLLISSQGEALCNIADVGHHFVVATARPRAHFVFDTDGEQAAESRIRLFDMIATDRIPILAYHFPWPGLGHLGKSGDAYRYFPMPLRMTL